MSNATSAVCCSAKVLLQAAHAGLPIVIIDPKLSEVTRDGVNALFAKNTTTDLARKVTALLRSKKLRDSYGAESKNLRVSTVKNAKSNH